VRRRIACRLCLAGLLWLTGCGRYGDFTLPPLAGGDGAPRLVLEQRPEPVMGRGRFRDVLNPSVVRSAAGYLNFYSAFDGETWRTGLAESADGLEWKDRGIILSPDPRTWEGSYIAANGSALLDGGQSGGQLWYWYQSGPRNAPRIGLARGGAETLHKEAAPVLEPGPYGSWDEAGVADPDGIRAGAYFYLYYLGQDRARPTRQRVGVARSTDGLHWEKLRTNPVLDMDDDEAGLGEPAVWSSQGFYWMLYTVRDFAEQRRLRLARSRDGVHWEKLRGGFAGSAAWNAKALCDATVVVEAGEIRVWFGGGDKASPDENLDGQIGAGRLRFVN
jgi:predicted GH43/DUF377 family glycosyl hydrolase